MRKILIAILLGGLAIAGHAQPRVQTAPGVMPYGKVDIADLEMKVCDFEKDANAEVLFAMGDASFNTQYAINMDIHKRIKIFSDKGMKQAEIRIPFLKRNNLEFVTGIEAQTINLVNGKPEITKLDKKLIYTKAIDKFRNEIAFTFPNVKPGSIIEYKYTWSTVIIGNFPNWFFQDKIPVRYSEYITTLPDKLLFRTQTRVTTSFVKNTTVMIGGSEKKTRALANIHSLADEPYMSSYVDNLECLLFQLTGITSSSIYEHSPQTFSDTWAKVGGILADDEDFGKQLRKKLKDEDVILRKAATFKTDDEKIICIFNEVKNTMKWNGVDRWYTNDGTPTAWEKKIGNSAEINLIVHRLLQQAGVEVYPMVVSTREHGKIQPFYTSAAQFNRAVTYAPQPNGKFYILDASNKYNVFNEIPEDLLNSSGLYIDKSKEVYSFVPLLKNESVNQSVVITADIKADGKIEGAATIRSLSYNRKKAVERYKTDGEKKYIEYLQDGDNGLKIKTIKMENIDVDTLPLLQNLEFSMDLGGSDDNYITLNPNMFASLKSNPFLAENRLTDIEFGYNRSVLISGRYKMPNGYKVDALPKNAIMNTTDNTATFKRVVAQQGDGIIIRCTVEYKKPIYTVEEYDEFYQFAKKMYEMLNEPIILKKG